MRIPPLSVDKLGSNADSNSELGLPQSGHTSAGFLGELFAQANFAVNNALSFVDQIWIQSVWKKHR